MKIVPATPEMVEKFCKCNKTVRAVAVVDGEKVLGLAGIHLQYEAQLIFSWIGEELKKKPRMIFKTWKVLLKMINCRIPVVAQCDHRIPRAAEFLAHLGFVPVGDDIWRL